MIKFILQVIGMSLLFSAGYLFKHAEINPGVGILCATCGSLLLTALIHWR